jgi:hypothetical protein
LPWDSRWKINPRLVRQSRRLRSTQVQTLTLLTLPLARSLCQDTLSKEGQGMPRRWTCQELVPTRWAPQERTEQQPTCSARLHSEKKWLPKDRQAPENITCPAQSVTCRATPMPDPTSLATSELKTRPVPEPSESYKQSTFSSLPLLALSQTLNQ